VNRPAFTIIPFSAYFSTLKMQVSYSSLTSLYSQLAARYYVPITELLKEVFLYEFA
jgi:hypothetical protein